MAKLNFRPGDLAYQRKGDHQVRNGAQADGLSPRRSRKAMRAPRPARIIDGGFASASEHLLDLVFEGLGGEGLYDVVCDP